jgi:hypothetical protein
MIQNNEGWERKKNLGVMKKKTTMLVTFEIKEEEHGI